MSEINSKLEQMAKNRNQGSSVEEAIRAVLGDKIADQTEAIRRMVHEINSEADRLEKKYSGRDVRIAVFEEIDEQCGKDIAAQFRRISDLKYVAGLRNLEYSGEELKEQGMDLDFVREMLTKTHDTEQEMAESATAGELETLRSELESILPEDGEGIKDTVKRAAKDGSWTPILETAEGAAAGITDEAREDLMILSAALLLSEQPQISVEEAAAASVVHTAQSEGDKAMHYVWMAIPAALAVTVTGLVLLCAAAITGLSILQGLGALTVIASTTVLSILALLAVSDIAYEAVKKAIPYVKEALEKARPHVKSAAEKVKKVIADVIGVFANKVYRPAVRWVKESAMPVIRENVIHPLKRRLEKMIAWLKEKKDQVVAFVKKAAAPEETEAKEAEVVTDFDFETETEENGQNEEEDANEDELAFT